MFHGFSDHIDRYYDLFPQLASRGIAVYGLDQRGWGRSVKKPSDRGRSGPTSQVLSDMAAFIRPQLASTSASASAPATPASNQAQTQTQTQTPPVFVAGHSMGGGQTAVFASTPAYDDVIRGVRGWLLIAPFLGFAPALQPSWLTVASGRLAAHVLPGFKLHRPIPPENVTRDPEVQRSLAADELNHDHGTLEGLAGMLDRAEACSGGAVALRPGVAALWVGHGTEDRAASFDRSRDWFGRQGDVRDKTFRTYEGAYHQLHADLGRDVFYREFGDWILERCDGDGDGAGVAGSAGEQGETGGNNNNKL
ncbi:Alpha/Beta hydrolase protein [Xylariomycetidae sp. FL2044]|nr:Alpha/Beta hydrolase protein [Xylariomycetidae sp. FL2044]